MRRRWIAVVAVLALAAPGIAQTPTPVADAAVERDLRADVTFLASDDLKGRLPGTPEFAVAADYVASRFLAAGLHPAGTNGAFLEAVPLARIRPAGGGHMVWRPAPGAAQTLMVGVDYFPGTNPGLTHASVAAPIVFIGYGLSVPVLGHDDYHGLDVRGKIVAVVAGGPLRLAGDERGILWDARTKRGAAAAHGAAGIVFVQIDPAQDAVPFATSTAVAARPELSWLAADGSSRAGPAAVPLLATLSEAGARKVFGRRWSEVVRAGHGGDPAYRPIAGAGTLDAASDTQVEPVPSANIVGLLPGSDPTLANQIVVVSAHLDHLGAGTGPGDHIYSGALDNAIGVAAMIATVRMLSADPASHRRSILFLALTGEEAGLIGSDYFVNDPAMPVSRIVADVNLDMPILTYRFEDMIGYGADHSTLAVALTAELARQGLPLSPDPVPGDSLFIRSDQFSFVRKNIPAVMLWPGRKGPGAAATDDFIETRYHQPSDDILHPIDWASATRFTRIAADCVARIAALDQPPRWNDGDKFLAFAGTRSERHAE